MQPSDHVQLAEALAGKLVDLLAIVVDLICD